MMKKVLEVIAVTLIVTLAAAGFLKLMGAIPVSVTQTQKQSTFDVSGQGKVAVKPDQAEVSLGIQESGTSVKAVTERVDQKMTQLSVELKRLGIDEKDIRTTNYSVYQDYSEEQGVARSYNVSSNVSVKIRDIEKTGQVVDLIGQLGLTQSNGISFTLSDELKEKTTREAREMAIEEAKQKGEELAKLAGMKLGRIVNVAESAGGGIYPRYEGLGGGVDMAVKAPTPAQIEPGTSEVNVTVTLSYETR